MAEMDKGINDYGEKGMVHDVEDGHPSPVHSSSGELLGKDEPAPLVRALKGRHMQVRDLSYVVLERGLD